MDPNDPLLADAPRDEHGHVRLAEVPLARVLRTAVTDALAARGVKVTIGEKDVGYELRCGYPTAFDRDYTRDLGVGAVDALLAGQSARADHAPGRAGSCRCRSRRSSTRRRSKSRVRGVDTSSDSYRNALALQERVTAEDLADAKTLAAIAKAAKLSPEEARKRYRPL